MEETHTGVWICFAGHSARIKGGDSRPWRCYIGDDLREIPLATCQIIGTVGERNFILETNPAGDARGLVAWIRCFGDLTVDEAGVARIALREP